MAQQQCTTNGLRRIAQDELTWPRRKHSRLKLKLVLNLGPLSLISQGPSALLVNTISSFALSPWPAFLRQGRASSDFKPPDWRKQKQKNNVPVVARIGKCPMDADHVADVLVESVLLPAVIDQLLLFGCQLLWENNGFAHFSRSVRLTRRHQNALAGHLVAGSSSLSSTCDGKNKEKCHHHDASARHWYINVPSHWKSRRYLIARDANVNEPPDGVGFFFLNRLSFNGGPLTSRAFWSSCSWTNRFSSALLSLT